jgi:hypothetical protein
MDAFDAYLSAQRLTEALLRADTLAGFGNRPSEAAYQIEGALREFGNLSVRIAALRAAHEQKEAA